MKINERSPISLNIIKINYHTVLGHQVLFKSNNSDTKMK